MKYLILFVGLVATALAADGPIGASKGTITVSSMQGVVGTRNVSFHLVVANNNTTNRHYVAEYWFQPKNGDPKTGGTRFVNQAPGVGGTAGGDNTLGPVPNGSNVVLWVAEYDALFPFALISETQVSLNVPDTGNFGPAAHYKVTVSLKNSSDIPVKYRLRQGSNIIGEVTLQPHSALIQQFNTLDATPITAEAEIEGVGFDGSSWVLQEGAVVTKPITLSTPVTPSLVGEGDSQPSQTVPESPDLPKSITKPENATTIWKAETPSQTADLLTKSVYREGVDKQVRAVEKVGGDISAMRKTSDKFDEAIEREKAASAHVPSASEMKAAGEGAKADTLAVLPDKITGKGYTFATPSAPELSVTFPAAFGGKTIDFNPFRSDRMGPVASWFRFAMVWLVLVTLALWIWSRISGWLKVTVMVPQAKGNPLAFGTGAQLSALTAAGLMTAAIIVAVVGFIGYQFDDINFSLLVTAVKSTPLSGIPSGVYWMLDQLFPVATIVSALLARVSFNLYAWHVFMSCSTVCRFIVP